MTTITNPTISGFHQLAVNLKQYFESSQDSIKVVLVESSIECMHPEIHLIDRGLDACVLKVQGSRSVVKGVEVVDIYLNGPTIHPRDGVRFQDGMIKHWALEASSLAKAEDTEQFKASNIPWVSVMVAVTEWHRRYKLMTPLQREISRRVAQGGECASREMIDKYLATLGYAVDEADFIFQEVSIESGVGAGESYPGVTASVLELDTGLSFANIHARKDADFKKLQTFRRDVPFFTLIKGTHILEL